MPTTDHVFICQHFVAEEGETPFILQQLSKYAQKQDDMAAKDLLFYIIFAVAFRDVYKHPRTWSLTNQSIFEGVPLSWGAFRRKAAPVLQKLIELMDSEAIFGGRRPILPGFLKKSRARNGSYTNKSGLATHGT